MQISRLNENLKFFDSKTIQGYYKRLAGLFSVLFVKNIHQTTSKFGGIIRRGLHISLQEK